jgi:hypothetical protein
MARAVQLLVAVALFAGVGYVAYIVLARRARAGIGLPDYSLYSVTEKGLAGLAHQLRELGFKPVPLTRPVYQTRERGILIIAQGKSERVLDFNPTITPDKAKRYLEWVAEGNTLVLWGPMYTAIHAELGVDFSAPRRGAEDEVFSVSVELETAYTSRIRRLEQETCPVATARRGAAISLWGVANEHGSGGLLVGHGKGRVFVITDASLLTEPGRKRADNAFVVTDILARHAPEGRVLFDETVHGFRSTNSFFNYLHRHGQMLWLVQLGLIAVIALWAVAIRLGPPLPLAQGAKADAVDYAGAMARIYQQAGATGWLARNLGREFIDAVKSFLRLRRNASPAEIERTWRQRYPASKDRLESLLALAQELEQTESTSQARLLAAAQAFDEFRERHLDRQPVRTKPGRNLMHA